MLKGIFAEIIIDIPAKQLDRPFHYRVPDGMMGQLEMGMKVIVPFGHKTMEGIIVGFTDKADVEESKIKQIIRASDKKNSINPELVKLGVWMAERYMCTLSEALKAMFPVQSKTKEIWYTANALDNEDGDPVLIALETETQHVYQFIAQNGSSSAKEIKSFFGAQKANKSLDQLLNRGLIKLTGQLRQQQKSKSVAILELANSLVLTDEFLENLSKKSSKQARVLKVVAEHQGLTVAEISSLCDVNPITIRNMIKKGLLTQRDEKINRDPFQKYIEKTEPLKLNKEQAEALEKINANTSARNHGVFLLHGVTGSGKTEIYLQAIDFCLHKGRQAIVLVPEIALTPQTVDRFKARFGEKVAVLHSRLSDGERYDEWQKVKAGTVQIVVGARSAVFAPFDKLGLIVIDEEHEGTYKQEDNPKYHVREVAIARAKISNGILILGSATPSIDSYARALAGKYTLLTLHRRVMNRPLPVVKIVDLREEMQAGNKSVFSRELVAGIESVIKNEEQAMVFLNRRGFSTFVLCRECGLVLKCPRCEIPLTMHLGDRQLLCHYCDYTMKLPDLCPQCKSKTMRHFGVGTQKVEQEALRLFEKASIHRMDLDTTTHKGDHEKILEQFGRGKINVLIGTQMIAKGLDFPDVTLVGVVTADTSLNLPDYRAAERTFQLLTQVSGRAGRGERKGEVIVQTYNPEHYSVTYAAKHDFQGFYKEEIKIREILEYPPFYSLIRILIHGTDENNVIRGATEFAALLSECSAQHVLGVSEPVLGPAPAPLSKLKNRYRWQICLKGKKSALLREICRQTQKKFKTIPISGTISVSIDVDPLSMI